MVPPSDAPPLTGTRVIDLSSYYPGPLCAAVLAELGADVIKVERPGAGDPGRTATPGAYHALNRDKQVMQLDLKDPVGQAALTDLTDEADVVVQAFRAGTAEKMGAGAARLRARNPRLVYCAINGFGSVSAAAAHDLDVSARTGLLWMSGDAEREPDRSGAVPHADVAAATYAVHGILAALLRRERTGIGATLEVPMAAAALKLVEPRLADHAAAGSPPRAEFLRRPAYGAFRAGDGRRLALACVTDSDWSRLMQVTSCAELADDPRLGSADERFAHAAGIRTALSAAFATRSAVDWARSLEEAGVPVALVSSPDDLAQDPVISALGVLQPAMPGSPVRVRFPVLGLGLVGSTGEDTAAMRVGWRDARPAVGA